MAQLTGVQIVNNDWAIVNGRSVILTDQTALAQRLKNRLTLWYGEWYQDTTQGINWLALFNLQLYQERRLSVAIKKAILADPDVYSINSLSATKDSQGNVTITYQVASTFGKVSSTVVL